MQLEGLAGRCRLLLDFCFNSILVQLEVAAVADVREANKLEFQFHIGAIRSYLVPFFCDEALPFQFHIGAIRSALPLRAYNLIYNEVSIPYWCN